MSTFKNIEDLEIWKLSRKQSQVIWEITNRGTFKRDYSLRDQINRSSGSVMDNIAEGFGRGGNKEFVNFLSFARGSNVELQSQLYRALDREHICLEEFSACKNSSSTIAMKISKLMNYLRNSDFKGPKFE